MPAVRERSRSHPVVPEHLTHRHIIRLNDGLTAMAQERNVSVCVFQSNLKPKLVVSLFLLYFRFLGSPRVVASSHLRSRIAVRVCYNEIVA